LGNIKNFFYDKAPENFIVPFLVRFGAFWRMSVMNKNFNMLYVLCAIFGAKYYR